ncbi:TniQ family protein [Bacillus subtilis subsp. subtilis]|nr:TniQ family protein [Bacillus subtilis subsp. subtilis]
MRMGWPPLAGNELLSSYLSRAAIARGMSAQSLTSLICPGHAIWTRDVDTNARARTLEALAAAIGEPLRRIKDMTLMGLSYPEPGRPGWQGTHHWVTAIGVYHRSRRRHGLCFCPVCLAEGPFFRRQWRLAFWTVCPHHQVMLRDACPSCGGTLEPHRQQYDLRLCSRCNRSLVSGDCVAAVPSSLQDELYRACVQPHLAQDWSPARCNGREYLAGMDALLSGFGVARMPDVHRGRQCRERLEMRRVDQRDADLRLLEVLCQAWPQSLRAASRQYHVTQRCFRQQCPDWLAQEIDQLPPGRINGQANASRRALRIAAEAEQRRKPGWRSLRAKTLLKMITPFNEH